MELLVIIIVLALIFDYINGFHDAANSIATIVSTKVLTPFQAVIWAAFFNFVAFFIAKCVIGGFGIANTVLTGCCSLGGWESLPLVRTRLSEGLPELPSWHTVLRPSS